MEQQDPDDYLNYNYNSIYSNQFTDNTPNEDQNYGDEQDSQNLELDENSDQKTKLEKIIDLMKCYICFNTVQDAFMCPGCSNFACDKCIQNYLKTKKECPVCRKDLTNDQVVKCRFLKDFLKCVQNFNDEKLKATITSQQNQRKEFCEDHNLKMIYFCMDCNTVVCSDCVMFTKKHNNHKFERVKTIYDQKMDNINKELTDLKLKIQMHDNYLKEIDEKSQDLKKSKEEKARDLIQLYRQLNQRLDQDLAKKLQKLLEEKKRAEKEFEFYENMHQDIQSQIENQTASQVIEKANDFLQVLMEINSKNFIKTLSHQQYDLNEDLSIPYFTSIFYLKPYSQYKQQNDIVYSEPLIADGIEWRIKVYPNGTGIYNGLYLSLFVEMVSGWENGGSYCYKVKLINPNNEKENIQKEYVSDFENSICWGYNRFCKIDDIENQGFWDKEKDQIIIQYQVRPANHLQKLKDQENYIKHLEQKVNKSQQKNNEKKRQKKNRTMSEELRNRSYCGNSVYQSQRNKKNLSQVSITNKKFQSNKLNKQCSQNKAYKNDFSIERTKKKNKSLLNKTIKEDSFQRMQQILFIQIKFKLTIK